MKRTKGDTNGENEKEGEKEKGRKRKEKKLFKTQRPRIILFIASFCQIGTSLVPPFLSRLQFHFHSLYRFLFICLV